MQAMKEAKTVTTRSGGTSSVTVRVTNTNALKTIERLMEPSFFEGLIQDFLDTEIIGPEGAMTKLFEPALTAPEQFQPMIFGGDRSEGKRRYDAPAQKFGGGMLDNMGNDHAFDEERSVSNLIENTALEARMGTSAMFRDVWAVMQQTRVWTQGNVVYGGVGPLAALMSMALGPYMPFSGTVRRDAGDGLNSLFLAVEYGTGIAANVGASWVNLQGPTKSPHFPGAWTLGRKPGQGVLIEGQKGVHFLDDARSRMPLPIYMYRFQTAFPALLEARLSGQ